MSLGDFIRTERNKKGWSQRALAKLVGVTAGAVAQWELDATKPKPLTMVDLCALFGVQATTLFAPGGPYQGQFIDDPDELAWLSIWRRTPVADRPPLMRALSGRAPKIEAPKPQGKRDNAA